ncbi:hypothetical protein CEP53_007778 [Fusarium sp. AF-6]|nr:hypothetical protein CEP53_007778 [Fusarium sp. AF-6]
MLVEWDLLRVAAIAGAAEADNSLSWDSDDEAVDDMGGRSETSVVFVLEDFERKSRFSAAMDLSSKIGPEMARVIMAHDLDFIVMEKYYTAQRTSLPDLTSLALGENKSITFPEN